MSDIFSNFLNWLIPQEFMPHGHCYLWDPWLLRQNVISNALIGISYYCIPIALVYLVKKRKDLDIDWIFLMFSAFIFACGTTHFINIFTIWRPAYKLDAMLMTVTAILSVATLVMLVKLLPQILKIPSPSALQDIIWKLEHEVKLRTEAEDALRKLNTELDDKVSQRTLELTTVNQELNDAKIRLEDNFEKIIKINTDLNNFAHAASHDLKSPLHGISQLATWITQDLGDNLSSETQEHLALIRKRIGRMEQLLDDLLTYSSVGRAEDQVEDLNSHDLIQGIFDQAASQDHIKLNINGPLPAIRTKKMPLELVFRNLINNAIKHHDKAAGIITVAANTRSDGIEFVVTDDGPGIPEAYQQRVFAMFQTLKPRDEIEGSGIGLALVKKTIESMGGSINLESDGQLGTTIRFFWPNITPKT